jgi:hypothetical protein
MAWCNVRQCAYALPSNLCDIQHMAVSGAFGTFLAPWLIKRRCPTSLAFQQFSRFTIACALSGIVSAAKITICGMQAAITSAATLYILRNVLPQGAARAGLRSYRSVVTALQVCSFSSSPSLSLACFSTPMTWSKCRQVMHVRC